MYCITLYYSFNEIVMYMWRAPFLLGGMIGILGYWIRKDITESTKIQDKPNVVKQLSGSSILKPVKAIIIMMLPACLCINNLYFPSILSKLYNYDIGKIYSYITISLVFSAIISPIWGKLIDRFNPQKIIKYLGCSFIILYPLFHCSLSSKNNIFLLLFLLCHQFFLTGFINNAILILTQLFDNQIKCTMVALSYNIAFTVAGFSPVIIRYFEISLFISLIPIILVSTSIYLTFKLNIKL
jgi:MFS family permease